MKNLFKRVLSIAAATALLMTSVISAVAADPGHNHDGGTKIKTDDTCVYTITLSHPEDAEFESGIGDEGSHYGAYQIFSGTVKGEDYTEAKGTENPGTDNKPIPITDIKWGSAFGVSDNDRAKNILGFVYALSQAKSGSYSYAFSEFDGFDGFFTEEGVLAEAYRKDKVAEVKVTVDLKGVVTAISNNANVNYDKLAIAVADVLAETDHLNNREWLQAFNDILGGYGQGTGGYLNPGYVSHFYEGEIKSGDNTKYEIKVPAGYYMIRDLSGFEGEESKSYSARMLFVANNVEQELKEDVPTLTKKISRDKGTDGYKYETEVAGVGDEVDFRLTGTLPSNYDLYLGGYQYKFTDKLSDGLTMKDTDGVYVTVTVDKVYDKTTKGYVTGPFTIKTDSYDKDGTHTTHDINAAYKEDYNKDTNELTVSFPCLKEILIDDTYTLGAESVIYVDYTAIVNDDAAVKPKDTAGKMNGNTNTAVLTYSDNPQSYGDTDDTTEDTATVYSFGLDITKIDAAAFIKGESDILLNGAQFVILRNAADGNYEYATVINKGDHYAIDEWSTATIEGANGKALRTAIDGLDEKDDMAMTTDASGKLNITGLDADVEYTLVEIKTPGDDGDYAFIEPITFTINAEIVSNEYTGKISSVTETAGFSADETVSVSQSVVKNSVNTENAGIEDFTVVNFKYTDLPSTGGIGVYIYYIAGGCIVALAAVLFALSKKKKTTK